LFTRTPARQWQKGICTANSNFKLVLDRFIQKVPKETTLKWQERNSFNSFDYTFDFIKELFREAPYPLFKEAIKILDEDSSQVSKTLSKTYFIALCPILKTPYILFRNTIPVAFYSKENDEFVLIKDIYEQEIRDFIFRNSLNSNIRRIT
jgi:hypothetical protein